MKKQYMTPELDYIRLTLSRDILGDSQLENHDNPVIGPGGPGEFGTPQSLGDELS